MNNAYQVCVISNGCSIYLTHRDFVFSSLSGTIEP